MKKIPETDAIFEQLAQVNAAADADETALRLSIDAKGTILLALLSRGGFNRLEVKALDHDFRPDDKVTPVGVFLPQHNQLYIFLTTGPVTSDLLVDCIHDVWLLEFCDEVELVGEKWCKMVIGNDRRYDHAPTHCSISSHYC